MSANAQPLQIAVLVKQVQDLTGIQIDPETRRPISGTELVMNTFDAYAIGEAINLKEAYGADVTVICAGPDSAKDVLLRCLATGADRAVHIVVPGNNEVDTLALAGILASVMRSREFDLILAGQTSDDYETGQVPVQLAELLGVPHVSLVTHVEVEAEGLRLRRDAEASKEIVSCPMPAMLMILSGREGSQRYPSLRGMIAAKRKPVERIKMPHLDTSKRLSWTDPVAPEKVFEGIIVRDEPADAAASKLVAWLQERHLLKHP